MIDNWDEGTKQEQIIRVLQEIKGTFDDVIESLRVLVIEEME